MEGRSEGSRWKTHRDDLNLNVNLNYCSSAFTFTFKFNSARWNPA